MRRFAYAILVAGVVFGGAVAQDVVKDRKAFIPNRKQAAVQGKAIGILLTDGQPVLSTEGRSGPADQLVFSSGGNSYHWIYVPTQDNPQITNLHVPVGDKGEKAIYAALNLANPKAVLPWGVTQSYVLVEVEVNGGRGSPANDSFVASNIRVVEGTKEFPLKVADVVKVVKAQYADYLAKQKGVIEQAMADGAKKSLNGKAPTGPREMKDLMYLTWLPESATMRVHFRTTISDGAYSMVGGGANPAIDPPALPVPMPLPPKVPAPGQVQARAFLPRVPPPKFQQFKVGTTFGIDFGRAYVINAKGEVVRTEDLAIEPFTHQLAAPPVGIRPRPVPLPLPVPPGKQ